jgi:hypothetical protein
MNDPRSPYWPGAPAPDTPPGAILWARLYSGLLAVTYLGVAALGVFILVVGFSVGPASSSDAMTTTAMGAIYAILGFVFAIPSTIAVFAGRKKWVWLLHLVMIALGFSSCACWPICIPLIMAWLKPEVKAWYGA